MVYACAFKLLKQPLFQGVFKMRLLTTRRIVAALMDRYDIETKYGLAKLLSVSHKTARNWVDEGRTMDDNQAKKAAELLDLDYEYVLICLQLERSKKNPAAMRAWKKIADLWDGSKVALVALITAPAIASFVGSPAPFS
tara:strand:- start:254 stop:670 length:417 start_codon:yes stop_codon:yes gene_type:complete